MSRPNQSWAVIGGGFLGMTLALRLARSGGRVSLFEAAPSLGGLASAWRLGDVVWDRHYHVTLLSDGHTRGILRELGLEDEIRWVETQTGFYADGRLHAISSALDYLLLPSLGPIDKIRIGATILLASRIRNWRKLEQITVEDWLLKYSGRSAFERLWKPLLESKLGGTYRHVSAAFIWATIQRLYAARRTGLKKEMFGYVTKGGYARTIDRFTRHLAELGVEIRSGEPVDRVVTSGTGVRVTTSSAKETFDQVVVTTTCSRAAKMCPGISEDVRERLLAVKYMGIVCASMLLRTPLAPYYLTYFTQSGLPFTTVVEMTTMVDPLELGGSSLVYLPRYLEPDDPFHAASDDEIRASFLGSLRSIYPRFEERDVQAFRVSRVREVFPLQTIGYSRRLPGMIDVMPGLHLVNSAHIVNGTLNVNETIQLAETAAGKLLGRA